jgi:alkanesulfonate monooxygenase SsuD/methylene tetrahydromethanopterin reductase-like flavin-dependent oxidoreductase (luciferase family)
VARIHPVDHAGERFTVRGPLQVPRSPQGRLLLVQAGGSEGGRALAGRYADAVFASQLSIKGAREYYADIKSRAVALGRDPEQIAILPGLSLTIGRSEQEAQDRRNRLDEIAGGIERGLERLAGRLGIAPGQLDLDKPVPAGLLGNARNSTGAWGFADATVALIKDEQPTVRELLQQGGGGHRLVVGSPAKIADTMQEWFLTRACDGFNLMFDVYPDGLQLFVDLVVPELQRRGLFRTEYAAGTLLRSRYGLPRPASVYERADSQPVTA